MHIKRRQSDWLISGIIRLSYRYSLYHRHL